MRKYLALAILVTLGMASTAWAGGITNVQDSTTPFRITATVYNDSGSDVTSGSVVVWDNDDTEFDRSGYPYVTTTTTDDFDWVAGVVISDTIQAGNLGEIVIYGPAITLVADATDALTEDQLVGTSAVAGQAGDYTVAADSCALGRAMELRSVDTGTDTNMDGSRYWVFVDIDCQ